MLGKVEAFNYRKQLNDARTQYEKAIIDLEDLLLGIWSSELMVYAVKSDVVTFFSGVQGSLVIR